MKVQQLKRSSILGAAFLMSGLFSHTLNAQVVTPPSSVASSYETLRDTNVSDDFSTIDPSKWAQRLNKDSGAGSYDQA